MPRIDKSIKIILNTLFGMDLKDLRNKWFRVFFLLYWARHPENTDSKKSRNYLLVFKGKLLKIRWPMGRCFLNSKIVGRQRVTVPAENVLKATISIWGKSTYVQRWFKMYHWKSHRGVWDQLWQISSKKHFWAQKKVRVIPRE